MCGEYTLLPGLAGAWEQAASHCSHGHERQELPIPLRIYSGYDTDQGELPALSLCVCMLLALLCASKCILSTHCGYPPNYLFLLMTIWVFVLCPLCLWFFVFLFLCTFVSFVCRSSPFLFEYTHTANCQNKGNTNIKGLNKATTIQNSFDAPWHRFYKCLELYWKDTTSFFHKKFHNLMFCVWRWKTLRRRSRDSHKCAIGLRSGD